MVRVIALLDMDCFYAQVEQRDAPHLWDKPVVVVQHASGQAAGGILAVSYEARAFGVKRGSTVKEAKAKCPTLNVCFVPQGEHIDKADIQKYRDASAEVFNVLNNVDPRIIVERASVDEAFLDLTQYVEEIFREGMDSNELVDRYVDNMDEMFPSTHLGNGKDFSSEPDEQGKVYDRKETLREWLDVYCRHNEDLLKFAFAAEFTEKLRSKIRAETQFYCSGGLGPNKLVCARHKPRQQTVIPKEFVAEVFKQTPITDVRMLGGKLGITLRDIFKIRTMHELSLIDVERLSTAVPGSARWVWQMARGFDDEPVKLRNNQSSIAVSKNFPGRNAIVTVDEMKKWLDGLTKELSKRLISDQLANKRTAENLVFHLLNPQSTSRTLKINSYNPSNIFNIVWSAAKALNKAPADSAAWEPPVINIGMSASRFVEGIVGQSKSILEWIDDRVKDKERSHSPPNTKGNETSVTAAASTSNVLASSSDTSSVGVAIDEDGWQKVDFSKLTDVKTKPEENLIEIDDMIVDKDIFDELPDFIKMEFKHRKAIAEAREIKAIAAAKGKTKDTPKPKAKDTPKPKAKETPKPTAKRTAKVSKAEPPAKKGISEFFKKK